MMIFTLKLYFLFKFYAQNHHFIYQNSSLRQTPTNVKIEEPKSLISKWAYFHEYDKIDRQKYNYRDYT